MLPLRFVGLLVILLASQAWGKPAKSSEGLDYNGDETPTDYNDDDTADAEDDASAFEEPPQILSQPETIRVRNGSTIRLNCLVKNTDSFAVTWKKDDEILFYDSTAMNADNNRTIRLPNNTLVIHDARENDTSDHYECSILKEPPVTINYKVHVYTEYSPPPPHKQSPIRVIPGKKVEVNAGENLTLGCETRMQPPPEIKWFHETERVRSNVTITDNYITIMNVNRHDGGHYQCLVENGSTNPPMEAISVIVNYAPEIETKGKSVHTGLGVESRLTCIVHAHPHAKVTWFKNQEEVMPKKGSIEIRSNRTRHILEILHTKKENLGEYTCRAENRLGRAEKNISLTGLPSQAIIFGGEITKTSTGLILKWQLESYSPITEYRLQYRRKGDEKWMVLKPTVTNGTGNQFIVEHTIVGLQPGSYEAILLARNDFGWSQPSKPHTFAGDYEGEQAENVKGSPAGASHPTLAIATLFLVVSSCAFTSL